VKKNYLKFDALNRICQARISEKLPASLCVYKKDDTIMLEPVAEVPADEAWLFKAENRKALEEVKKGLKQKGTIKRGSFAKYLK